jgi:hypothetical protein
MGKGVQTPDFFDCGVGRMPMLHGHFYRQARTLFWRSAIVL